MLSLARSLPPQLDSRVTARAWPGEGEPCAARAPHASVVVVRRQRRRVSTLYRLRMTSGDDQRHLLAKQYRQWRRSARATNGDAAPPIRLFEPPRLEDKAPFEFAALQAIQAHVENLSDPRFAAVRPLAVFPDEQAIVMDEFPGISLDGLVQQGRPLPSAAQRCNGSDAFRHAGAWLRRFHELSPLPHTRTRHATRAEFVESIRQAASYLGHTVGPEERFGDACDAACAQAGVALPAHLPAGLSHSDFGPRNVLLSATGKVAVIDTLARWQAPVYEDIGHFIVALHTAVTPLFSPGMVMPSQRLRQWEQAFVGGYFDDGTPPWTAVRLFELQALLYHWSAVAQGLRSSAGIRRLVKQFRLAAVNRFLHRYLRRLCTQLSI